MASNLTVQAVRECLIRRSVSWVRVWHGPRGIQVEPITLDRRPRLRITQTVGGRTYLIGYAASVREVAEHVDLADLVEVVDLPVHPGAAASCHPRAHR